MTSQPETHQLTGDTGNEQLSEDTPSSRAEFAVPVLRPKRPIDPTPEVPRVKVRILLIITLRTISIDNPSLVSFVYSEII